LDKREKENKEHPKAIEPDGEKEPFSLNFSETGHYLRPIELE
jgi:hypothetical protein